MYEQNGNLSTERNLKNFFKNLEPKKYNNGSEKFTRKIQRKI